MVIPVLCRNDFFAHSERILLALLDDDDKQIGIDASNKTQKIKAAGMNSDDSIRKFKPPAALKLTTTTLQDLYETNSTTCKSCKHV